MIKNGDLLAEVVCSKAIIQCFVMINSEKVFYKINDTHGQRCVTQHTHLMVLGLSAL